MIRILQNSKLARRQVVRGLAGSFVAIGSAGFLAACSSSQSPSLTTTQALSPAATPPDPGTALAGNGTVKVALLLPLTGDIQLSLLGKGMKQAAELALFERNAPSLQLIVKDDKGTKEGAAAATTEALADGAELILGPLFGGSVPVVAAQARQLGVPVIAFSNDPSIGGNGVYLLSFFYSSEATRVFGHAMSAGKRHFAALLPDNALGSDTEPAMRQAVQNGGGRFAVVERYPADLSASAEPIQKVMEAIANSANTESPIDALFLPSAGDNVPRLVAMLRHHKFDPLQVKLLVTSGWDNPSALRDPRVHGAWLAAPDQGGWREFAARFGKAYNAMPPRIASLVYDAVTIASSYATQPKGQRFTSANLTRPSGFTGIDGPFRLTSAGPVDRSLAVLEIQSQGLVVVSPASGFTGTTPAAVTGPLAATTFGR